MTRMTILMLVVLVVLLAGPATGSEVTISLPQLTGDYETGWLPPNWLPTGRRATFTIPPEVVSIDQMRLVISGTWVEGLTACMGDPTPNPFTPGLSIYMTTDALSFPDVFHGGDRLPAGPFENRDIDIVAGYTSSSVDFNALLGSEIDIDLSCAILLIGICSVSVDSYGTLTDVRLEILGVLASDETTWGQVKGLYR